MHWRVESMRMVSSSLLFTIRSSKVDSFDTSTKAR
jgi:hypothetical protein